MFDQDLGTRGSLRPAGGRSPRDPPGTAQLTGVIAQLRFTLYPSAAITTRIVSGCPTESGPVGPIESL
jgi:hypothetical protein